MAQPCKVFSYTNVGTEKGVLANIASAAQAGGWTVDKNAVDADGELYLHSAGGGNRRLFFSLRLLQAHDNAGGKTINYTHKGGVCASVPQYNAALLQNSGTLRHMLIKPLLYVCNGADVRLAGELPYWAVNLHGLKPKDRISIGSRVFMVLPDISDSDEIGLAVEVEA